MDALCEVERTNVYVFLSCSPYAPNMSKQPIATASTMRKIS